MNRLFALLVILLLLESPLRAQSPEPTAEAVVQQAVATYRSMTTYQDRGRVVQTLKLTPTESDPAIATVEFSTVFKRPNKFRFSWTKTYSFEDRRGPTTEEIGSDGDKVWSWSSSDTALESEKNMGMAVAGATGVTYGAAHQILRLLTDDVQGFRIDELKRLKIVRSETVDGIDCDVLHGFKFDNEVELWIGKQDHLIRKSTTTRPDTDMATVELHQIAVDKGVPDEEFALHGASGQ